VGSLDFLEGQLLAKVGVTLIWLAARALMAERKLVHVYEDLGFCPIHECDGDICADDQDETCPIGRGAVQPA
jgi:hypothetical protein